MRSSLRLVFCLLVFFVPQTVAAQQSQNLDFEENAPSGEPTHWYTGGKGYAVAVDTTVAHTGRQSLQMERTAQQGTFGVATASFPVEEARGYVIRYTGYIKTDSVANGYAGLWWRIDGEDRKQLGFDNMAGRGPTSTTPWTRYTIEMPVPESAQNINFGALLTGSGTAWFDRLGVSLTEGVTPSAVEEPQPLSERGLQNLVAFTRLLGYVRHFHPSDEAAEADWNALAIKGVRAVEDAPDAEVLVEQLQSFTQPVAPTVRVATVDSLAPAAPSALFPSTSLGALALRRWKHLGYGNETSRRYSSERTTRPVPIDQPPANVYDTDTLLYDADLSGGASAQIPLAVFADSNGTLPRGTSSDSSPRYVNYTAEDRATRLAAVALAWNVFQHFYPYFDVVGTDWNTELRRALRAAATDPDAEAFKHTLDQMVAALDDGHGGVSGPGATPLTHTVPFTWDWIENQLVVTHVASGAEVNVQPGDVVAAVDGTPAADTLAALEASISGATPQSKRYSALRDLRYGSESSTLTLRVTSPDEKLRTVTAERTHFYRNAPEEPRPEPISEIRPGILYVNLGTATTEQFNAALPRLEKTDGLVFDLRGYPRNIRPVFLQHLSRDSLRSARWMVPVVLRPDREGWSFDESGRWTLPPKEPYLDTPRVFLTDGRAISYAESILGIVEHYDLAEIVGSATAGTNGNVNTIALPGGHQIHWTGMKVLKHDGTRHHGIGIQPTVPASRTIEGVQDGRDEVLERGVEVIRGNS